MHAQFARGAALIAFVLLKNGQNETLLKFAHTFGIKNVAAIHLQDKCFQLISHDESLFFPEFVSRTAAYFGRDVGDALKLWGA